MSLFFPFGQSRLKKKQLTGLDLSDLSEQMIIAQNGKWQCKHRLSWTSFGIK